ncbi:MAG TPA: hypothetical protein VFZ23_15270 [Pyrinomonadaceae bacterium]
MGRSSRSIIIAVYIAAALYVLPMYPHGGSANELTRWATAASLIEKGSFEISWTEELIGPNVDTATIDGKTYSNKAPGAALAAAPFYAIIRPFIGPPTASNIRVSWFVMKLAVSTAPLLLLALLLYRKGIDDFGLVALLFASPLFVYSLLFFSHAFAAVLVYVTFRLLFDEGERKPAHTILAGFAAGLAVISEFPAVFAVAVFGIGILFANSNDRVRQASLFALGGLPFAIFLLIYNNALFGSPLSMSYAHESFPEWAEVAAKGVFGIGIPTFSNAFLLLFSPSRGLFFFAPILLLCAVDLFRSAETDTVRHRVKATAILVSVLILCGHGAAHGGWSFGPRYLVFVIPLILDSFLTGRASAFSPFLRGVALTVSVMFSFIGILTFPFAPPEFRFPHNDFWGAFLVEEHWPVPTLLNVLGIEPSILLLLPLLAAMVLIIVLAAGKDRTSFITAAGVAALLVGGYLLVPISADAIHTSLRRATIAERYFRPAGRLDNFRRLASEKNDTELLRSINKFEWMIADARAFAPDDFPYLRPRKLDLSPTTLMRSALRKQERGAVAEAEAMLINGRDRFPFARCEFATNLAVIFFTTGRADAARRELESIQALVGPGSLPDCVRSQFLLGTLYRDSGLVNESETVFRSFLTNTANLDDPMIRAFRKQLTAR